MNAGSRLSRVEREVLGLAVAKALARDGTAVVIGDIDEAEARAAAESIRPAADRPSAGGPT